MGAGVGDQELAGDVGRAGEEEHHRFGHLLGRAGLAQRRGLLLAGLELVVVLLAHAAQQPARLDETRAHRVDAHRRRKPARQGQRQRVERTLGAGVRDRAADAHDAGDRRDVHDRPAILLLLPLFLHHREDGAAHHVGAGDVDAQDAVEILGRHTVEVALVLELGGAGIVDQPVDAAPLLHRLVGQLAAALVLAHVGLHQDRLDAPGLDRLVGLVGFLLALGVVDGDVPAALRQIEGTRGTQPRRRARHNRYLAGFRHVFSPDTRAPFIG